MGIFPAVSRMVRRGDVKESDVVARRYVSIPDLAEGKMGFEDQVKQEWDVKTFDSDKVPARSLAAARCVVEFTDEHKPTPQFDLSKYIKDGVIHSATGQLAWKAGKEKLDGYITIDTPATKAVVGFAKDVPCKLGNVTITSHSPYAAIFITASEPDKTLAESESILVTAIARARNTGMKIEDGTKIVSHGKAPILMERVQATVEIRGRKLNLSPLLQNGDLPCLQLVLNHDKKSLEIDTGKWQSPYFLLTPQTPQAGDGDR